MVGILLTASTASFGLGYLAGLDAKGAAGAALETMPADAPEAATEEAAKAAEASEVVASKYGTKYYLPECAGASRISPANKISFPSAAAAAKAGYTPAANCKGL